MSRTRIKPAPAPTRVNGRPVSSAQAQALRAAARAEAAGRPAEARRLRLRLEAELGAAAEAAWLAGALAETAALEAGRGGTVERSLGRVRIRNRDGLLTLSDSGALDSLQVAAGLRYRDRFEGAHPRTGSALAIRPGGRGGLRDAPERLAARQAQARRELDRMERAVAARYAAEGRPALATDALMALREVAGLGRAVRELSGSGRRRTALTARLGEALATLAG